jgi:hypothetical protein
VSSFDLSVTYLEEKEDHPAATVSHSLPTSILISFAESLTSQDKDAFFHHPFLFEMRAS